MSDIPINHHPLTRPRSALVLINHTAEDETQLNAKEGDRVQILKDESDGYCTVRHIPTEKIGKIPSHKIEITDALAIEASPPPQTPRREDEPDPVAYEPITKRHHSVPPIIFMTIRNLCVCFSALVFLAWIVMGGLWLQNLTPQNTPDLNSYFWSSIALAAFFFVVLGMIVFFHYMFKCFTKIANKRERIESEEREQLKVAHYGDHRRNIKIYPFFGYSAVREPQKEELLNR